MLQDSNLTNPANYIFNGPSILTSSSVEIVNVNTVDVITDEILEGEVYTVTVHNVKNEDSHLISPSFNSFSFVGRGMTKVYSATATNSVTVQVVFNCVMLQNSALTDPTNYTFTGDTALTASNVVVVNDTTVDVTVNEMLNSGSYTVTVQNVKSSSGSTIEALYDNANFTGMGVAPQVSSVAATDVYTVRVIFDSLMSNTGLTTIGNYEFNFFNKWVLVEAGGGGGFTNPSARGYHTMAYDSLRDVTVLFGGYDGADDDETWEWNGTTAKWAKVNDGGGGGVTNPSPRRYAKMVYDSLRHVTVLFGGHGGAANQNDTWEWDGVSGIWVDVTPVGTKPEIRCKHGMTYDSSRHVTVLFGGTGVGMYDDTWEWNGITWTKVNNGGGGGVTNPSPRLQHAMTYDSFRNVTVLFGGDDGADDDETWEWNGTTAKWAKVNDGGGGGVTNPSRRSWHTMAYDSSRHVTVLFGGNDGVTKNDTWEWNGANWSQQYPTDKPAVRQYHAMVYDSSKHVMVLFGGKNVVYYDDTWGWERLAASVITPVGVGPNYDTVDVTVNAMTNGVTYHLVITNVTDIPGNTIAANNTAFIGMGVAPQVLSATIIDATHIDVLFDKDIT
jgi:hypothetical protein